LTVPKLPGFVSDWTNPIEKMLKMFGTIVGDTIGAILPEFFSFNIGDSIPKIKDYIISLFEGKSTINDFKVQMLKDPLLAKVGGIMVFFTGLINFMLEFIKSFPGLFIK
jgi:hypothetical protein